MNEWVLLLIGQEQCPNSFLQRYISLKQRWDLYIKEFDAIRPFAIKIPTVFTDWRGQQQNAEEYKFDDISIWDNFAKRWRLGGSWDYEQVLYWTGSYLLNNAGLSNDIPNKMSLRLSKAILYLNFSDFVFHNLPVEVLQSIFKASTTTDARLLSSTCSYLRQVSLPFIFGVSNAISRI